MAAPQIIAFTDLDGTVNDQTLPEARRLASIGPARRAIATLETHGVTVGIATGRSLGEALHYRAALGATGPVICEYGAVVATGGALGAALAAMAVGQRDGLAIARLASVTIDEIHTWLRSVHAEAGEPEPIISTCEVDPARLAELLGHESIAAAARCADRQTSAVVARATPRQLRLLVSRAPAAGLRAVADPLHLIAASADKATALRFLRRLGAQTHHADFVPVAFGNDIADVGLLTEAIRLGGIGVLVGKPGGGFWVDLEVVPDDVLRMAQPGALGLAAAVPLVLSRLGGA